MLSMNKKQNDINKKEESDIYELVNLISSIEKKIYELNKKIELNKKNELFQNLSSIEEEILKRRKIVNNYNEIKKKEEMKHKKMISYNELNNQMIEMDLEELNQKINNIISDKRIDKKEIYTISNEEINNILSEKKNKDGLKYTNIDYNYINKIYQNIFNYLKIFVNKREILSGQMNMIKEEILTIKMKIIEYISKKESFEESAKFLLFKFFINIFLND